MTEKEIFTITEEHLKLMKRMVVGWDDCEYGAPQIDPKRPYGNGDVVEDIKEIVSGDLPKTKCPHCREEIIVYPRPDSYYEQLHKEMKTVLQIFLVTGQAKPGVYQQTNKYDYESWEKVN